MDCNTADLEYWRPNHRRWFCFVSGEVVGRTSGKDLWEDLWEALLGKTSGRPLGDLWEVPLGILFHRIRGLEILIRIRGLEILIQIVHVIPHRQHEF